MPRRAGQPMRTASDAWQIACELDLLSRAKMSLRIRQVVSQQILSPSRGRGEVACYSQRPRVWSVRPRESVVLYRTYRTPET